MLSRLQPGPYLPLQLVTIVGAGIGTVLAVMGMYQWLIPFLVLLGTFIPPIGGVIMASYFVGYKRQYPNSGHNNTRVQHTRPPLTRLAPQPTPRPGLRRLSVRWWPHSATAWC